MVKIVNEFAEKGVERYKKELLSFIKMENEDGLLSIRHTLLVILLIGIAVYYDLNK